MFSASFPVFEQDVSLASWALKYAELGWPVLPVVPGGKKPATNHGCLDATTNLLQVRAWWVQNPRYNIGLATGHVFDVVDVDGPTGATNWRKWWMGPDAALLSSTPKGQHWFFEKTGYGNKIGMLPSVDYRGKNGYVVAPPSVVDEKSYYWIYGPENGELLKAPDKLHSLICGPSTTAPPRSIFQPRPKDSSSPFSTYGANSIIDATTRITEAPEGTRNGTLNKQAFRLYRLVAEGEIIEDVVNSVLAKLGEHIGLEAKEVLDTIRSARRGAYTVSTLERKYGVAT